MDRILCVRLPLMGAALALAAGFSSSSCSRAQAVTPDQVEKQYGVSGAYSDTVKTADGDALPGTVVPVTMADGRKAQLVIPHERKKQPHSVYLRDNDGLHPVEVDRGASRNDVVNSPRVVAQQPEPQHREKRSWEKDALIIGGGAGAGAGIGAIAGGKKGAAVGAAAGGVGGLIYDLATRDKPDRNK
jgi:hypothetical protein